MDYTLGYIILNVFVMILGVFAHFAKKKIKGQTMADFKIYFSTHLKDTVVTAIAAIVAFIALITTCSISVIASFSAGYMCDSIFNKNIIDKV